MRLCSDFRKGRMVRTKEAEFAFNGLFFIDVMRHFPCLETVYSCRSEVVLARRSSSMGIPNLLPFVKKACRQVGFPVDTLIQRNCYNSFLASLQGNISELSHQSVGVDVSCLLHRGLIGCADKVAHGSETDLLVSLMFLK